MNEVTITDNSTLCKESMNDALIKGMEKVGLTAEAYAKLKCPVDTGRLRNSISHVVQDDERAVYIGTNVEYAAYVELGTINTRAQSFLRPAAQDHGAEYKSLMESEFNNV